MKGFISPMEELEEFRHIREKVKRNRGIIEVSGCIDSQKSHMMYCFGNGFKYKIIASFGDSKAKEIYEDYRFFDKNTVLYPAKDLIFYQSDVHGNLLTKQRMMAIKKIIEQEKVTIITSVQAFMDNIVTIDTIKKSIISLAPSDIIDLDKLKQRLISLGYERNYQVETAGQFSIRGGIIDIFSLTEENPFRIELWDDEIDTIRYFDVESQRSIEHEVETANIYPATEIVLNDNVIEDGIKKIQSESVKIQEVLRKNMKTEEAYRIKTTVEETIEYLKQGLDSVNIDSYIKYFYKDTVSFLDYFDKENTILFLDEPARVMEKCRVVEKEFSESMQSRLEKGYILPKQADILFGSKQTAGSINKMNTVALSTLPSKKENWEINEKYSISVKSINSYNNSFELLVKDLERYKKIGSRVILLSGSVTRAKRLAQDLMEYNINSFYTQDVEHEVKPGEVMTMFGNLKKGYEYPMINFAVICESDIFGREIKKKKKKKSYSGQHIQNFSDLSIGDYVVHENHGLGIYRGIEKVEVDKIVKDYIKIEYSGSGTLYILATQLDLLMKYANADAKKPKLNKLGTTEWKKTKNKVKTAVWEIANDLVELYAVRQSKEGYCYGADTVWQREFEEMFPYEETDDQLAAIEAAKADMESHKIMDRLVCGDVGFGKTEIAIRVAFKAVQENKQVVYLVPTTILAQQHYNTFVQRMKDFPVRVDLLCRFKTAKEQKKTIEDLKKGLVDIVIGTHRVLSKDVEYKNLGLLIIDEEQRFGVTHKEKIKKLRNDIDVLALTATPIPRTLHMSLIGIRDMSVLEDPPIDRMPIQTYVMEYDEEMVREAINRELSRGGQVYYVYNRVNNIDDVTLRLASLVPEARVEFAHGQMHEHQLEHIMYDFINGDINVLVSTTIIETGLDISNVNTIIVHDADNFGLSQLYQLRGRVGRANRTSYAYLMYRRNKMLKEVAQKRLHAIKEFTELGSGIKIAMKDLEIRGAGNILGEQQHGHMAAVGYDLYCKMLNEAVSTIKGGGIEEYYDTTIDVNIDAYIPDRYITNEFQKLDIYKRIAGIENEEEYDEIISELIDRFGEPPKAVQNLMKVASIKAKAHERYIIEIAQKAELIKFTMYERANVDANMIPQLIDKYKGRLKFTVKTNPYFVYLLKPKSITKDIINAIEEVLEDLKDIIVQIV